MPSSRVPRSFSFPSAPRRFFESVAGRRSHSTSFAAHRPIEEAPLSGLGASELAYLAPDLSSGALRPSLESAFGWLEADEEGKGGLRRRLPNMLRRKGSRKNIRRPSTATEGPPTRRLSLSNNLTSPASPAPNTCFPPSNSPSPLFIDFGPSMLTALDGLADCATDDDAGFFSSALAFTYPSPPPSFPNHRRSRSLGLPATSCSSPVRRAVAPGIETVLEEDEDRASSRAPSAKSSPFLSSSAFPSPSLADYTPTHSPLTLSISLSSFDEFFLQLRQDFPSSSAPSSAASSSASSSSSSSSSPQLGHSFALAGSSAESLVDPQVLLPQLKPRKSGYLERFGELAGPGPAPTWALPALPGRGAKVGTPATVGAHDDRVELEADWDVTMDGDGSEGYWDALEEFEGM